MEADDHGLPAFIFISFLSRSGEAIDLAALEKLDKPLLRFRSLDDLHDWLDPHAASDA